MVSFFKKKKEVVDFRKKDSDMPIPLKMRERLLGERITMSTLNSGVPETPKPESPSSGGFFNFFGGGSDSSSTASSPEPKTDFWGNPVEDNSLTNSNSSSSTSTPSYSENLNTDGKVNDLIYKLSRMTDRLELVEKKLERLERKMGISV